MMMIVISFLLFIVKNGKRKKKLSVVSVSEPVTHRAQNIFKIMTKFMLIQMNKF